MKSLIYAGSGAAGVGIRNNYALTSGTSPSIIASGAILYTTSFQNKSYNGGTFSGMWVYIPSNTRVTDTLIRFVNNGVVGNQSITIPAGATGFFADTINTDTVVAGDEYAIGVTFPVGGNTINISQLGMLYDDSSGNYVSKYCGTGSAVLNNITRYTGMAGNSGGAATAATEGRQQTTINADGAIKNLTIRAYVNSHTADITYTVRVNGVNSGCTVTVPAGTLGFYEDTVNTVAVVAGDVVTIETTAGASTGTLTCVLGLDYESSGLATVTGSLSGSLTGITPGLGKFYRLNCSGARNLLLVQSQLYVTGNYTVKNPRVRIWTNGHNATSTWTLQKNGVDTAAVLSVPATTPGEFVDSVNTVDCVPGDLLNWKLDMPGAGNSTVFSMAFDVVEPASGADDSRMVLFGVG